MNEDNRRGLARFLGLALGAIFLAGALGWSSVAGQAGAAASHPALAVSPATAAIGQVVLVTGTNLPPNDIFQVQVCGQNAVHGSPDCASASTATVQTDAHGGLSTPVGVTPPPTACPCVVAAFSISSALTVTTSLSIPGAATTASPTAPPTVPRSHVVVAKAEFNGSTPVAAWLGLPATRTLALTLRNSGAAPATSVHLVADLNSTPVVDTHLPNLGVDETRTYEVPITIPSLTIGNEDLNGHIFTKDGQQTTFKVPVTIWPVGLLLAAIVLVQMILLAVRNVMRRRYERKNPPSMVGGPDEPATQETEVVATGA